jgi:hypothetical protein
VDSILSKEGTLKMSRLSQSRLDMATLCCHFPESVEILRHLVLKDMTFRSVCEDYCLADRMLEHFKSLPGQKRSEEVADYQALIAELRDELNIRLQKDTEQPAGDTSGNKPGH